ncbi:MAG: glycoside hydrolase family 3 N-terminal domain-containing protein [Clostridiaceae bacterium]|nr:glycoside hydrolase family 3 N-terminal domain-containing protein [Clostridiaceae bacterium]
MNATLNNFKKALSIMLAICLALACTVAVIASSGSFNNTTIENATAIAKQIEAEGIVLLKNERGSLPLADKKVNVFGMGSINFALGGGGSGSVASDNAITLYQGLENAGIEYNPELLDIYKEWADSHSMEKTGQGLVDMVIVDTLNGQLQAEMPFSNLSTSQIDKAAAYSQNAILVITRTGAELSDLSTDKGSIRLSDEEMGLVEGLNAHFDNVIILFNTCNILQMDWLANYENVNSALLVWTPGEVGADSIGRVLTGEINPSGKLPDTIAYDINDYPSTVNFGSFAYSDTPLAFFVNYQEGIYVGYRYFETFLPGRVQYPFGYGLSYTAFDWEVTDYSATADKISVSVKVTNTGSMAGKDVVEVYFSAPYYPGGIEKSAIELAGYKKTAMIQPGASDTVTVEFKTADMASYDYKGAEAWVLEAGDYQIKVGHTVRDFEAVYDYTVASTKVMKYDDKTGVEIKNLFSQAAGDIEYLSRQNLKSRPTAPTNYSAPDSVKNCDVRPDPITEGTVPRTGVVYEDGPIMLADVAADETLWDKFLDQFTVEEMIDMIAESGYKTAPLERLGVPETVDNDGPATVKGPGGLMYKDSGLAYPSAFCLACTWNDELAEQMGESMGNEANDLGTNIWYAPACNLHRSPMGGRNFEYYSEDPYLSGKMATAVIKGAQSKGIVVTVKHFACNDQETNRLIRGVFTWTNEQAMRELYLEPFEMAVKEGEAKGVMTAYNRIGSHWCSGYPALCKDLLRTEWGFDGFAVTDAYIDVNGSGYMDPVLAVYARNDALLTSLWYFAEKLQITSNMKNTYEKDPIGFGTALREATYDLCRVKMQTAAFDPTATTGHRGEGKILSIENGGGATPSDTNKNNGSDGSSGSSGSASGGSSSAKSADGTKSAKTGFVTNDIKKPIIVALASVAVIAATLGFVAERKREEEIIRLMGK